MRELALPARQRGMKIRVRNPWNILPLKTKSDILWNANLEPIWGRQGCSESVGTDTFRFPDE
jgi:hypothetical protein